MGNRLFGVLREQVEPNARHAVEVYRREVAEYRSLPGWEDDWVDMLEFAVFLRSRTADLAVANLPLTERDLTTIAEVGRQRAELGLSVPSQQQVLKLHTGLMLREIADAAGPDDVPDLLRTAVWFGEQGARARAAYLGGYTTGVGRCRAQAIRIELIVRALLADEPTNGSATGWYAVPMSGRCLVSVLRFSPPQPVAEARADVDQLLVRRSLLAAWLAPDEFVLLTPGADAQAVEKARNFAREVVSTVRQPCQVGSVEGTVGSLADGLDSAREVSRVAPLQHRPERLYGPEELFVEMSVAHAPEIDAWLRTFVGRLASVPYLVSTLAAYYRNDMGRTATATALNIHRRTLDYRLQRVRTITGVDPGSTMGVRILSVAIGRLLAGGWT